MSYCASQFPRPWRAYDRSTNPPNLDHLDCVALGCLLAAVAKETPGLLGNTALVIRHSERDGPPDKAQMVRVSLSVGWKRPAVKNGGRIQGRTPDISGRDDGSPIDRPKIGRATRRICVGAGRRRSRNIYKNSNIAVMRG